MRARERWQTGAEMAKAEGKTELAKAQLAKDEGTFAPLVAELRRTFDSGRTRDLSWRRGQLQAIQQMIKDNHEEITAAIRKDLGGPKIRGFFDIGSHQAAGDAIENLEAWTRPEQVPTPMQISPVKMARSYVRREPKGVVLIIGPWNFPFELCLHPLVAAIAAGNCAVIKPSEMASNTAQIIERLVHRYLDPASVRVVQGAVAETSALLREHWDHIMYTGNGAIGRIVLRAAAEHLTPVTLELGGKCPVIVDKSANMQSVVERVSFGKWTNAGQICVAPDYVLIHKDREEEFVQGMRGRLETLFGKDPKQSSGLGRIINADHVRRIGGMLSETKGQVVVGGIEGFDPESRYAAPTIVKDPQPGEPLLTEEIFGPVLPVVRVDSLDEAIQKANSICDRPLALYVFSEDKAATEKVLNGTLSGGTAINTVMEQLINNNLPFGGVGSSGTGAYHGKAGFDEFTHLRSVLHQDTTIMKGSSFPPKVDDKMYDLAVKMNITGFLSEGQRKAASFGLKAAAAGAVVAMLRAKL